MENCSLALRIPARADGGATAEMAAHHAGSAAIDVWSLAVDAKVDLLKLSYKRLPRRIAKVGRFTAARYNATEQWLPSFACESGTYHAFLFTCPEGARKEDCWVDVTSTNEELVGECHALISSHQALIVPFVCSSHNRRSIYGTASDDLSK